METNVNDNVVIEYYKLIKSSENLGQLPKVECEAAFVNRLDKMSDDLKIPLVATYVILNNAYKSALSSNRAKMIKLNIHSRNDGVAAKRPRLDVTLTKINKYDLISSNFMKCTSKPIKIAVALFLCQSYLETLKGHFICSILNDESPDQTVSDIIQLCRDNIGNIRNYISVVDNTKTTEKQRKQFICAFIELSEILRDRSCAKLAMHISMTGYISLLIQYLDHDHVKLIIPFEPLINYFVQQTVKKYEQQNERAKIVNQFNVERKTTIHNVVNGLPPLTSKVTNQSNKGCVFKPDQTYQYYKGSINYTRDIATTYHVEQNRRYRIQTYNDCLYDVLGCAIEYTGTPSALATNGNVPQSSRTIEYELYDKMSWLDRMNLIHFRTKVLIEEANGSELNAYKGASTDITISWFDDSGISVSKTITIKKTNVREKIM